MHICIPTDNSDSICICQDSTISMQNSSYSPSVAATSVVLTICISSNLSSAFSKTADTSKRKVSALIQLHACELSNNQLNIKSFPKELQTLSQNQDENLLKVCDAKWIVYSNWCHRKKVNPVLAPLTVIADFLIYLFSEKKYQISILLKVIELWYQIF